MYSCLVACTEPAIDVETPESHSTQSACVANGRFTVATYGAIDARIDWRGDSLDCDGMRRPHGKGARLRFAGVLDRDNVRDPDHARIADRDSGLDRDPNRALDSNNNDQRTLAFILSIPDLNMGRTGNELPTRLTLIEEDEARFFSTQEADICWSNVEQRVPLHAATSAVELPPSVYRSR